MRLFLGVPSIQELECSGSGLDAKSDLLSMAVFTVKENRVLAFVNFAKTECSTFSGFSACAMNAKDSHKTHLKILVLDLSAEQAREYGCNVTELTPDGVTRVITWYIVVKGTRKC